MGFEGAGGAEGAEHGRRPPLSLPLRTPTGFEINRWFLLAGGSCARHSSLRSRGVGAVAEAVASSGPYAVSVPTGRGAQGPRGPGAAAAPVLPMPCAVRLTEGARDRDTAVPPGDRSHKEAPEGMCAGSSAARSCAGRAWGAECTAHTGGGSD